MGRRYPSKYTFLAHAPFERDEVTASILEVFNSLPTWRQNEIFDAMQAQGKLFDQDGRRLNANGDPEGDPVLEVVKAQKERREREKRCKSKE